MIESISKVSLKKLRSDLTAPEAGTDASEANQFPADISQWSEVHVLHWLEVTIALPQYCNRFKDGAVDGNGLMTQITGEVLASLFGIHDEQHRSQILSGIQDLKQCQVCQHPSHLFVIIKLARFIKIYLFVEILKVDIL